MDNKILRRFYQDARTREVLYNYIVSYYSKVAVERTFAKQDVSHLAEAKDVLDKAFRSLAEQFAEKTESHDTPR